MKKTILIAALALCLLLSACGVMENGADTSSAEDKTTSAEDSADTKAEDSADTASSSEDSAEDSGSGDTAQAAKPADHSALFEETKDFILNGQGDVPQADRLLWSSSFLEAVDFETMYQRYVAAGGKADDVEAFATYLTENATVPDNWKALFEQDLMDAFSQKVDHYEDLGNDNYQVYVKGDSGVVPFVAVNARTGWYHG